MTEELPKNFTLLKANNSDNNVGNNTDVNMLLAYARATTSLGIGGTTRFLVNDAP